MSWRTYWMLCRPHGSPAVFFCSVTRLRVAMGRQVFCGRSHTKCALDLDFFKRLAGFFSLSFIAAMVVMVAVCHQWWMMLIEFNRPFLFVSGWIDKSALRNDAFFLLSMVRMFKSRLGLLRLHYLLVGTTIEWLVIKALIFTSVVLLNDKICLNLQIPRKKEIMTRKKKCHLTSLFKCFLSIRVIKARWQKRDWQLFFFAHFKRMNGKIILRQKTNKQKTVSNPNGEWWIKTVFWAWTVSHIHKTITIGWMEELSHDIRSQ